jgi:sporulation protein YlmC with PRC-barrel domain
VITHTQVRDLIGAELLDGSGDKVGKIGQIYLDDITGDPEWATVNTGLLGMNKSFVPLAQADRAGQAVRVPYEKSTITDAPDILLGDGHLDESQERELYAYYGLDYADQRSDSGVPSGQAQGIQKPKATEDVDITVTRATVPVDRVMLTKETVQAVDQMSEQVRKERTATDGDTDLTKSRRTRNR